MKTEFIENLTQAPVKQLRKRTAMRGPVTIVEESAMSEFSYEEMEEYRFEAKIGARFLANPNAPNDYRGHMYTEMLASVTNHIYGEVRREVFKLFPFAVDVGRLGDREQYDEFKSILNGILEMTKP